MAKRVKKEEQEPEDGHGVSAFRGNGFDPDKVLNFVERIENLHQDLAVKKGEFMSECRLIHDDVKEVLKEAKNAGIPKKSLKAVVKKRQLTRDIDDLRDDLEGEDQDSYDQLLSALGDFRNTDLGGAAADRAAA